MCVPTPVFFISIADLRKQLQYRKLIGSSLLIVNKLLNMAIAYPRMAKCFTDDRQI